MKNLSAELKNRLEKNQILNFQHLSLITDECGLDHSGLKTALATAIQNNWISFDRITNEMTSNLYNPFWGIDQWDVEAENFWWDMQCRATPSA
jgi:hypothetical protein